MPALWLVLTLLIVLAVPIGMLISQPWLGTVALLIGMAMVLYLYAEWVRSQRSERRRG